MPDPLPEDLARALDRTADRRGPFGAQVHYFHEIGSTNDVAARLADAGAPEGLVVAAGAQTAGRGRFGRSWFSPPGAGLYASVVIRETRAAPLITLAGGVAVAEGIRHATGLALEIKWPNDVVTGGGLTPRRKVAGILAEASTGASGIQHVVLGFGINLSSAAYPVDIAARATSLEAELGRPVDPGSVLAECLAELAVHASSLSAGDSRPLLERWKALAPSAFGGRIEWDTPAGPRTGRAAGIDETGALLVRSGEAIERILSGTVRWG